MLVLSCAGKKSSYKFNELFRHAEDGAKGQKDVKYRGKHHALAQVLKSLPRAPLPSNSAATIQQRAPEVKEVIGHKQRPQSCRSSLALFLVVCSVATPIGRQRSACL